MRIAGGVAALVLVPLILGAAGCGRKEPPMEAQEPAGLGDRVRVLNADALVIDGKGVRLANGSAPQPLPHARCWAEAAAALHATRVVRGLVSDAHTIEVTPTGGRDEYNRQVAQVALDGADVGDTLYAVGLAGRTAPGKFDWCAPLSVAVDGAPKTKAMMDLSR